MSWTEDVVESVRSMWKYGKDAHPTLWRTSMGIDTSKWIEDLSEEPDIKEFVTHLSPFMLQIKKSDGKLYPPVSLQGLFRGIGRFSRARQEQRIAESGVPAIKFKIVADPMCPPGNLRQPVDCDLKDVIETFSLIIAKRPSFGDKPGPYPMFLTPRPTFQAADPVWYGRRPVGKHTLRDYTKRMVRDIPEISHKRITNKTGKVIGTSRMEEENVLIHVGMKQRGHRDAKSYAKYNPGEAEIRNRAAQMIIAGETRDNSKRILFEEAFQEERDKYKSIKVMV
ncbi:hypothetical protein R1flu_026414 [Riccia fluitans]|uniref:Uncharacterized protein n=1 Tax=Riccia fluitans TaxID=41844 RepID=A0ABD1XIV8_9MARC